jgi:hypothetical protein
MRSSSARWRVTSSPAATQPPNTPCWYCLLGKAGHRPLFASCVAAKKTKETLAFRGASASHQPSLGHQPSMLWSPLSEGWPPLSMFSPRLKAWRASYTLPEVGRRWLPMRTARRGRSGVPDRRPACACGAPSARPRRSTLPPGFDPAPSRSLCARTHPELPPDKRTLFPAGCRSGRRPINIVRPTGGWIFASALPWLSSEAQ